jgi:hypothetical protein
LKACLGRPSFFLSLRSKPFTLCGVFNHHAALLQQARRVVGRAFISNSLIEKC